MFERFTTAARETVVGARQQARALGHHQVGTEHTLLALVTGENAAIRAALHGAAGAIGEEYVRAAIIRHTGTSEPSPRTGFLAHWLPSIGGPAFSERNRKALELSLREAVRLKHRHIGPEHLLLGILREGSGRAMLILAEGGVDFAEARERLTRTLESPAA
ncbi:Clp protease N-terminal domain-containing protein [Actinoplanes sp. G11-F43]|uniref:Clp protease N-terminal domain-containing protein n=1 Tax=Actinoplanes sp. G11-F43 TaxID=3424130 RepID=UPI003D34E14C